MKMRCRHFLFLLFLLFSGRLLQAQYRSLLWEISGNGLSCPSYVFGTMHVSNKLAFNLSDSFYDALRRSETVCLEIDPVTWQDQMLEMEIKKSRLEAFTSKAGDDFLREGSLRISDFAEELKQALSWQPAVINNLLYRSYSSREDFQEDTFLDMFIYQTACRMRKKVAGLENYERTEKRMLEAITAMSKETSSPEQEPASLSGSELIEQMESAYRRGDLDALDSLDRLSYRSEAFRNLFIIQRNEIQARAIDSLLKTTSVFAGVGAAHLPGEKGIIAFLRKLGYQVRPVMMTGKPSDEKDRYEKMPVAVIQQTMYAEDSLFSVQVPGKWYRSGHDAGSLHVFQYADMANATYYTVSRIRTYAAYLHLSQQDILRRTDSMLYENIPGKISEIKPFQQKPFNGMEIMSRTRRGHLQRYRIYITPFELIIFKASGPEYIIQSGGIDPFFSSIQFRTPAVRSHIMTASGGLMVSMPGELYQLLNQRPHVRRMEYESVDTTTGNAYLILRSDIHQFNFIGEDSMDLRMMEESFCGPDFSGEVLERKWTMHQGYACLQVRLKDKRGLLTHLRFLLKGPHYYVLAMRGKGAGIQAADAFFQSCTFMPDRYHKTVMYTDTVMKMRLQTFSDPGIDEEWRKLAIRATDMPLNLYQQPEYRYWPASRYAVIRQDTTGEMVMIRWQAFPEYDHIRDTASFWKDEIEQLTGQADMQVYKQPQRVMRNGQPGYLIQLRDTASSRCIHQLILLHGDGVLFVSAIGDTISGAGALATMVLESVEGYDVKHWDTRRSSRMNQFFSDLLSSDSIRSDKAYQSIQYINFRREDIPAIVSAMQQLNPAGRHYYDTKSKLIGQIGEIQSGSLSTKILKNIYDQVKDTVIFQHDVIRALARNRTNASYQLLLQLLVNDPPVFDNDFMYRQFFLDLSDSLSLSAGLFPGLLKLYSNAEMKPGIIELLATLADSGHIKPKEYASYVDLLLIDARVEWKKQRIKEEKKQSDMNRKGMDGSAVRIYDPGREDALGKLTRVLMPLYDDHAAVRDFFKRLQTSRDDMLLIQAIGLLLTYRKPVPDSLINRLASSDKYRAILYATIEKTGNVSRFPIRFKTQELMARSLLVSKNEYDRMDSVSLIHKQPVTITGRTGQMYFFRYRVQKEHAWKLGISGMQPADSNLVTVKPEILTLTDTRLTDAGDWNQQSDRSYKRVLFSQYASGKKFYLESMPYRFFALGSHGWDE